MNKYGIRLKELREKHGYTQDELAKRLNTSRSRIGMYEQGKRQPDFEMQEAIADLFNVSIDYLFGRDINNEAKAFDEKLDQLNQAFEQLNRDRAFTAKEIQDALEFKTRFEKAAPEIQTAIRALLGASQPGPSPRHLPADTD